MAAGKLLAPKSNNAPAPLLAPGQIFALANFLHHGKSTLHSCLRTDLHLPTLLPSTSLRRLVARRWRKSESTLGQAPSRVASGLEGSAGRGICCQRGRLGLGKVAGGAGRDGRDNCCPREG